MFDIKNLSMVFNADKDEKDYALKNVSLSLPDTGFVGIIGPSGSGKSTLMYCMSTLKDATSGAINYAGKEYSMLTKREREELRRKEFGFIFQRHFLISYMTAIDNVMVASVDDKKIACEKAISLLTKMGFKENDMKKRPSQLSGGQRQRVAIARAMINNPKVLFCDEPTASLDHDTAFVLMDILKEFSKDALVLVITHDRSILKFADSIIEIWDGEISSVGKVGESHV